MKALIIGGSGYLGQSIASQLQNEGYELKIYDLQKPANSKLADFEFIKGDIRDETLLPSAMQGCDIVFQSAAMIGFWKKLNQLQWDINVNGTLNVLKACEKASIKKLVYTSSVNTFGYSTRPDQIGDETTASNWAPFKIGYMDSKLAADQHVLKAAKNGLPAVLVHPGTIFGGTVFSKMNANNYVVLLKAGKIPACPGGGTNCVGLQDVARGHLLAAKLGVSGEQYILGGDNLTYVDLFAMIAKKLGVNPPRIKVPLTLAVIAGQLSEWASVITKKPPELTTEMVRASNLFSFYSSKKAQDQLGYTYQPMSAVIDGVIAGLESRR